MSVYIRQTMLLKMLQDYFQTHVSIHCVDSQEDGVLFSWVGTGLVGLLIKPPLIFASSLFKPPI